MKAKVTLKLEEGVAHRAKILARRRGMSLSGLVDLLLSRETGPNDPAREASFSRRWAGKFRPAVKRETRYERLERKYDLPDGD